MRNTKQFLMMLMLVSVLCMGTGTAVNAATSSGKCGVYEVIFKKTSTSSKVTASTYFTSNNATTASVSVYVTATFKNNSTGVKKNVTASNGYVYSCSCTANRPGTNYSLSSSTSTHRASFKGYSISKTL